MLESPVEQALQQREAQRGVADDLGLCQELAHFHAAGFNFAPALAQTFQQHAGQVQPFALHLHAAGSKAADLLAHDAGAPGAVHLVAQGAQAAAVDAAGGGQRRDAFQRRGQGSRHFAAQAGQQRMRVQRLVRPLRGSNLVTYEFRCLDHLQGSLEHGLRADVHLILAAGNVSRV